MISTFAAGIQYAWLTLAVVWAVTAARVKPTVRKEALDQRIGHLATFAIAFGLLFAASARTGWLALVLIPPSRWTSAAGFAVTAAGAGFAVWSRFCLGGNWSALVALKAGHTLVRTGPYTVVRHPIYAGLLAAMAGTAIARGDVAAFVGVAVAFAGWLAKARREESFLLSQFGELYLTYRREVKTLVPFVL